jgi:hypothetical protein
VPIEYDPKLAARVSECICQNFLAVRPGDLPPIDAVLMNPPYEANQDLAHVLHALTFAPWVYVIARTVFLHGAARRKALWSKHRLRRLAILASRPSFELGGDKQGSPLSDFCFFEIAQGPGPEGTQVTWI